MLRQAQHDRNLGNELFTATLILSYKKFLEYKIRGYYKVHIFLTILHIMVCVVLVLVVLLQAGKGASMGAAFGGSSQTIFGSSGPGTFLGKMTTGIAVIFMLTSFSLSYFALHKGPSLMEKAAPQAQQQNIPPAADQKPGAEVPQTPVAPQK